MLHRRFYVLSLSLYLEGIFYHIGTYPDHIVDLVTKSYTTSILIPELKKDDREQRNTEFKLCSFTTMHKLTMYQQVKSDQLEINTK